jgi:hypothetical protein
MREKRDISRHSSLHLTSAVAFGSVSLTTAYFLINEYYQTLQLT